MNAALNYDQLINGFQDDISKNIKSINFYFGNSIIFKLIKLTKGVLFLRAKVKLWIRESDEFSADLSQTIEKYTKEFKTIEGRDLSELIIKTQRGISEYSSTMHMFESNPAYFALKYADFRKLNSKFEIIVDQLYTLQRIWKRANKKTPVSPSELAQQTAAYSINNLSQIINAPR